MKYFSMFSGIGGFELGIQQAYEEKIQNSERNITDDNSIQCEQKQRPKPLCVGYSEIDKYAIQIYEKHFKHKNYGDATKIDTRQLPDFDLLVGGFPCQAFSIAGKRKGFDDTRGTLFFEIARILADKRPRNFVLENVKGLLSHDNGKTFQTILGVLADLGYFVEWQVLNSKNHGVPQNRERVFFVGHLRGKPRPKVFPIGEISGEYFELQREKSGKKTGISCLNSRYGQRWISETYIKTGLKQLNKEKSQGYRVYDPQGIASTLAGEAGGVGAKTGLYAIPVLTPDRPNKRQNGRRFKEDGDPSFTLTGQDKHGIYDGMKIRRLTPTECERLQGFLNGWTEGISDTQRYKTLGNAITVNVVREVMKKLL